MPLECWLAFRHLQTNFFETWFSDMDHEALHFVISLDDFDLHSSSSSSAFDMMVALTRFFLP